VSLKMSGISAWQREVGDLRDEDSTSRRWGGVDLSDVPSFLGMT
jgi:hypothetical protein